MVFLPVLLGRSVIAEAITRMIDPTSRLPSLRGSVQMSQRQMATRTGIPRSTIQDFLRDPSKARQSTIDRIARALESPALRVEKRGANTVRVDAPIFTDNVYRQLIQPPNAQGFRYVYQATDGDTNGARTQGFATSRWYLDESPGDPLTFNDIMGGPESIVRVVWSVEN